MSNKLEATFGPGSIMPTLGARIENAISWKKLPWGGQDKFVQLDANAAHAVWAIIDPIIREAQSDAWDKGMVAGATTYPNATNPYRTT